MKGKGKNNTATPSKTFDNHAFEGDGADEANSVVSEKFSPRIKNFGKFTYPNVCKYCKSLWDSKGNTELISPCGCDSTSLHVHETCLESWLKSSGKVRCEACKTVYSNSNIKELRAELMVQRVNFCLIAIFMPIGVVVIVGVITILEIIRQDIERAAVTGESLNGVYGIPLDQFVILCLLFGGLTLFAIIKSITILRQKRLKTLDSLTVTKA
ncbi:E3 ubiquitin-protein ligase MARCHF1-like [Lytechinus variegatus]|uniref:E3 ubiquitin-protein ligase MARCHF1-like n=1 Tax=Lytechinus variegatus TaxID=7654 RepID=UPI001BB21CD0|nr:E3 ubiquitin-protein ligase MARCHF1-like [Lytechinus variegatus]